MSGHTPGPWVRTVYHARDGAESFDVFSPAGNLVCNVAHEANARLIAAAPDLLEALKALTAKMSQLERHLIDACAVAELHGFPWTYGNWSDEYAHAWEAIAKAEGK